MKESTSIEIFVEGLKEAFLLVWILLAVYRIDILLCYKYTLVMKYYGRDILK